MNLIQPTTFDPRFQPYIGKIQRFTPVLLRPKERKRAHCNREIAHTKEIVKMKTHRALLAFVLAAGTAAAGPPLICHPFSIGNDTSLPWGNDQRSWNDPNPKY